MKYSKNKTGISIVIALIIISLFFSGFLAYKSKKKTDTNDGFVQYDSSENVVTDDGSRINEDGTIETPLLIDNAEQEHQTDDLNIIYTEKSETAESKNKYENNSDLGRDKTNSEDKAQEHENVSGSVDDVENNKADSNGDFESNEGVNDTIKDFTQISPGLNELPYDKFE